MGLIQAAVSSVSGVLADQWKDYFYCESLPTDVLVVKGRKKVTKGSSNKSGGENIITNGSVIAVADGQCMMIVEQGRVVDFCAEPGEYTYDASTEPSLFSGDLGTSLSEVFANVGKRFTFGGQPANDQRIYYFNTKEIIGNKYGTPSPIPFRVVDERAGIDIDIAIRCFGEYSYMIKNPLLFYVNVCGNVSSAYMKSEIESQLKSEFLTALQPAFARISEMGIRYSAVPGHTAELAEAMKAELSAQWAEYRGIEVVRVGVSSVKASEEDENMIKELQKNAAYMDPRRAAATLVGAQASAMQAAASNTAAGPSMAFMGMNMANQAGGVNAQDLYAMGQQQAAQQAPAGGYGQQAAVGQQPQNPMQTQNSAQAPAAEEWTCTCGQINTGKFCLNCGTKKPAPAPVVTDDGWVCDSCGTVNKGKFCTECGAKKPAGIPQYRCDKCGWEPPKGEKPPKFCPECGDPFDDGDIVG